MVIALATGVRALLRPLLGDLVLFAPYYPATLFITVVFGWEAGAAVAAVTALLAAGLLAPGLFGPTAKGLAAASVFLVSAGVVVGTAQWLRRALHKLEMGFEREAALNAELQHRVKNTLMVVQSIAAQSAKSADSVEAFSEVLEDRIQALATAHNIISKTDWKACPLAEIVRQTLKPFDRVRIFGGQADCEMAAAACVPLVLVLHELATNASKYGALSGPDGWAEVRWRPEADAAEAVIAWSEHGGPAVAEPTRRGFGSRLLRGGNGLGSIKVDFARQGLRCQIPVPLAARG